MNCRHLIMAYHEKGRYTTPCLHAGDENISCPCDDMEPEHPKEGTWAWACEQLLSGEQVTRRAIDNDQYLEIGSDNDVVFLQPIGGYYAVSASDIKATDWDIYEEQDSWEKLITVRY